jgi:hydroxyethylthiazole kinase-like uncharacterized protein yjeF
MQPIFTNAAIRRIESAASSRPDPAPLMQLAGDAAAAHLRAVAPGARSVLVLAGPGNNGGDAFVVARRMRAWFYRVTLVFTGSARVLGPDARAAHDAWLACGGNMETAWPDTGTWDAVVDGLFGIGLVRALDGEYAGLVGRVNAWRDQARGPVLALDVPSGIHSDTGAVLGCAVRASHTVSFIGLKPGLLTLDGPDHAGEVTVESLGIAPSDAASGRLLDATALRGLLAPRPLNFHKGSAGSAGLVGGASGMAGAALIAGRAALRTGAGRVLVGMLDPARTVDPLVPELMLRSAEAVLDADCDVLAAGPGMGTDARAAVLLGRALDFSGPLVLDADALSLLALDAALAGRCAGRAHPTLITPHPGEAARLLGKPVGDIQADRLGSARALAARYRAEVVLKGNGSVLAAPDGRWSINASGHPGMAAAGMGDALTGLLAGLVAQGALPGPALAAAVWLHGMAGERCMAAAGGPLGVSASELIDHARCLLNERPLSPT